MPNLGAGELVLILLMLVLVFGASRLPQLGEGFGKAIRNFKRGLNSDEDIKVVDKRIAAESSAKPLNSEQAMADAELVDKKSSH